MTFFAVLGWLVLLAAFCWALYGLVVFTWLSVVANPVTNRDGLVLLVGLAVLCGLGYGVYAGFPFSVTLRLGPQG